MKFILITPPYFHPHEKEILEIACELDIEKIHIRKPNCEEAILETYLDTLGESIIEISSLHYYEQFFEKYSFKSVHLSSFQRKKILTEYNYIPKKYYKPMSTSFHSTLGLKQEGKGFDYAFCSPIFKSISKQGYEPAIHWDVNDLDAEQHPALYALGGITSNHIEKSKARGFIGVGVLGAVWNQKTKVAAIQALKNIKSACDQLS